MRELMMNALSTGLSEFSHTDRLGRSGAQSVLLGGEWRSLMHVKGNNNGRRLLEGELWLRRAMTGSFAYVDHKTLYLLIHVL